MLKFKQSCCPLCGRRDDTVLYEAHHAKQYTYTIFSARRKPDRIYGRIVKCRHDGMVRSDPIIDPSLINTYYAQSVVTYKNEQKNLITSYMHVVAPVLKSLRHDACIVEIGCGDGFFLEALHGFRNKYGVELSASARAQSVASLRKRIVKRLEDIPEDIDAIFLFQTLDHIPYPNNFLSLCYKRLKKNGYIVSVHHDVESIQAKALGKRSPIIDVEHTHLYSKKTTKELFEKNGYKIHKIWNTWSYISLAHLTHLLGFSLPLPISFWMKLGNIGIIAQK